jgi:hypothetical protein
MVERSGLCWGAAFFAVWLLLFGGSCARFCVTASFVVDDYYYLSICLSYLVRGGLGLGCIMLLWLGLFFYI